MQGNLFFAIEIDTYIPPAAFTPDEGWGSRPFGAYLQVEVPISIQGLIRASDTGYATLASDPDGVQLYPGLLDTSFMVDRGINLDPSSALPSTSFGSVALINSLGQWDEVVETTNSDRRQLQIYMGYKLWDPVRQYAYDPPYSTLMPVFGGLAGPWYSDETSLQVPVRDAQYWLTGNAQRNLFGGTLGLDGPLTLAGTPIPKTRGGTAANPIMNITPVLVDSVALIYRYSDSAGTVVAQYEGGLKNNYTYIGDVDDLYAGSVPPGEYRTCNRLGALQFGTQPTLAITLDVTGAFPDGSTPTTCMAMALQFMLQDCLVPINFIDVTSFTAADTAYPMVCGFYLGPTAAAASTVLGQILQSIGAKMIPTREGVLQALVLRYPQSTVIPQATLGVNEIVSCIAQPTGAALDPPPYRYQVSYAQNWTPMTSGYNTTLDAAQIAAIGQEFTYATSFNANTELAYSNPTDPAPVTGFLLRQLDAAQVAADLLTLFGSRLRMYEITLPMAIGFPLEIGDLITVTFPTGVLRNGSICQIIREQIRPSDGVTIFYVIPFTDLAIAVAGTPAPLGRFILGFNNLGASFVQPDFGGDIQ